MNNKQMYYNESSVVLLGNWDPFRKRVGGEKYNFFRTNTNPSLTGAVLDFGNGMVDFESEALRALVYLRFVYRVSDLRWYELLFIRLCWIVFGCSPRSNRFQDEKYVANPFQIVWTSTNVDGGKSKNTYKLLSVRRSFFLKERWMFFFGNSDRLVERLNSRRLGFLAKMGLIEKRKTRDSTFSLWKRACFVDDELVESSLPEVGVSSDRELFLVNPKVYVADNGKVPDAFRAKVPNLSWLEGDLCNLWIEDPVTAGIEMYDLCGEDLRVASLLTEGKMSAIDLDLSSVRKFQAIGLLYDSIVLEDRRKDWQDRLEQARISLKESRVAIMHEIINPTQINILRRYARLMDESGYLDRDSLYSTNQRFWLHEEQATALVHSFINGILNEISDRNVKPGDNALTLYKPGAQLPRHRDDVDEYVFVGSLVVDAQPEVGRGDSWPIYVSVDEVVHKASLGVGDIVIIDPHDEHWRDVLESHSCCVMLHWFMDEDFFGKVNQTMYY